MDLIKKANALAAEEKTEEALSLYREAVRKDPGDVRGHCGMAAALLDGRPDEAAGCAKELIGMLPGSTWPHGVLGMAMEKSGRTAEAIACYEKMLEMDPEDFAARFRRALLMHKSGMKRQAVGELDRLLTGRPSGARAAAAQDAAISQVLGGAEPTDATLIPGAVQLRRALFWPDAPDEPDGKENPEQLLARAKKMCGIAALETAVELLDEALAADPGLAEAHSVKAEALSRAGRHSEAVACLDEALRLRPGDVAVVGSKGMLLEKLGRAKEAVACYDRAIEIEPGETLAYYLKCGALAARGDAGELAECYRAALASEPSDAEGQNLQKCMLREYAELERRVRTAGPARGFAEFVESTGVRVRPRWGRA